MAAGIGEDANGSGGGGGGGCPVGALSCRPRCIVTGRGAGGGAEGVVVEVVSAGSASSAISDDRQKL